MKNIEYLEKKFKTEIINKEDIQLDTAKFWHDEAEKLLSSTQDVIQGLHERAYKIMTFSGIAAAAVFSFSGFFKAGTAVLTGPPSILAFSALILYGLLFLYCSFATRQTGVAQIGIEPKKSMNPAFILPNDDKQLVKFYLSLSEMYQDGIDMNKNEIDKKSTVTQRCFVFFATIPFLLMAVYCLAKLWGFISSQCSL